MNKMQEQVTEFHKAFGVPVNTKPQVIDRERLLLRAKLIFEEASETIEAMGSELLFDRDIEETIVCDGFSEKSPDLIQIADGLADLLYVTFGACIELGIDAQAVFDEVHRSNMSKAWSGEETRSMPRNQWLTMSSSPTAQEDRYAVKREDGKIIKSPSYSPADISGVLTKLKGE